MRSGKNKENTLIIVVRKRKRKGKFVRLFYFTCNYKKILKMIFSIERKEDNMVY